MVLADDVCRRFGRERWPLAGHPPQTEHARMTSRVAFQAPTFHPGRFSTDLAFATPHCSEPNERGSPPHRLSRSPPTSSFRLCYDSALRTIVRSVRHRRRFSSTVSPPPHRLTLRLSMRLRRRCRTRRLYENVNRAVRLGGSTHCHHEGLG